MKKSRYLITAQYSGDVLLYNLINGTLMVMDETEARDVFYCLDNPNSTAGTYTQQLYDNDFLIDDTLNEMEIIINNHVESLRNEDVFNVTIVSTLMCNISCVYCFQNHRRNDGLTFTQSDYDGLYDFLIKIPFYKININWYGGEPLLQKGMILDFSERLHKDCNHQYTHTISTNCTIFDGVFIKRMRNYGLQQIDTTLAGYRDEHNSLRRSDAYTFSHVFNNIKKYSDYITVMININVCKTNVDSILMLINEIADLETNSIYITFGKIDSYENSPCSEIVMNRADYVKSVIQLSNYALDVGVNVCDKSAFQNDNVFCGAYSAYNITVGKGLLIYGCTDDFTPDNAYASIIDGRIKRYKVCGANFMDSLERYTECKECIMLPYCNGGCIGATRMHGKPCPIETGHLEDYLVLYYRIREDI